MILTIDRDFLLKMISSNKDYKLVDVMPENSYNYEHIKGAISIPMEDIEKTAEYKMRKDDFIVIYSKDKNCERSLISARKLESMGFGNIHIYQGGLEDYKKNYLPLEVIFLPSYSNYRYT